MKKEVCIVLAVVVCMFSSVYAQGPLAPPGAPNPSMVTLSQLNARQDIMLSMIRASEPRTPITHVPYTITASGSYYLTTNMTCLVPTNGISVHADNVVIDLCGFTLNGGQIGEYGIQQPYGNNNLIVHNGIITGWTDWGIYAFGLFNSFRGVTVVGCVNGLYSGYNATAIECMAVSNVCPSDNSYGIQMRGNAIVSKCVASYNGGNGEDVYGIRVTGWSLVIDCISEYNTSQGARAYGIEAARQCLIKNCNVNNNMSDDYYGAGIFCDVNAHIESCNVISNGSTGSSRSGYGIYASYGSQVRECTVARTRGSTTLSGGIIVQAHSRVADCISYSNDYNGIVARGHSQFINNSSFDNGQNGLYVSSAAGNRVEGNHCTGNARYGIEISSDSNLVVRNSCSANTLGDFNDSGTDNMLGPVATSMTNHPWANFSL